MDPSKRKRRVLVTGASGLVGYALCRRLIQEDWHVIVTGRQSPEAFRTHFTLPCDYFLWSDPTHTPPPAEALEVEAIFHLMGEPIADRRWSTELKKALVESRVNSTEQLVMALKQSTTPVQTFITASASGIYGDRKDEILEEETSTGHDFLADLCLKWESESRKAPCRSIQMRIGTVLSEHGGALKKIAPIFETGLGGTLGNGQQWMSWIHLDDLIAAFIHALNHPEISGPINATAPQPTQNGPFTKALAHSLKVSAPFPAPALALRFALGERSMILLQSQRMTPNVLLSSGFCFQYPTIDVALNEIFSWKETCHDRLYSSEQWIPNSRSEVFRFFSDEKNLETLTPEFLHFKVIGKSTKTLGKGSEINYQLKIHGIPAHWTSQITAWQDEEMFEDTQIRGPYGKWKHTHTFEDLSTGTLIRDQVVYRMPFAKLGGNLGLALVRNDIATIFTFRMKMIRHLFPVSPTALTSPTAQASLARPDNTPSHKKGLS